MTLEWWQYTLLGIGLALVWFFVEMTSYMLSEPGANRSGSSRFRRMFLTFAIFVLLFVIAVWAHRWVFL